MADEQQKRVSEIFFRVCDLALPERDRVLASMCGDDEVVRQRVLSMLDQGGETNAASLTNIVERGAKDASIGILQSQEPPPTQLGPYRVIKEIGEGGMSVVYEAEQSEPVRRHVALKVIRPGMDTREVIARFESERQALAVMDHPNIAQIFDAGTSDKGRPYFVMELVHGVPLTDYCDERQMTVPDRLALFISVCDAIAHAHQKGVVHRDLKPSNILVAEHDGNPQVKVIDFGIAKAVDATLSDDPLVTQLGQLVGTPGYMSPEQATARAQDIDTRTDVYSMGVVLYQLLVGVLPHDTRDHTPAQMRELVREGVTPRPSARLTQLGDMRDQSARDRNTDHSTLRSTLASSLDWVVLKAMEKERTRRYQSIYELKADVRNYLEHRPVLARPPSKSYVLGQFVRRNRRVVAVASVVFVALVAGIAMASIGLIRATKAERIAQQNERTAYRVVDVFTDIFEREDPSVAKGEDVRVIDVLDANTQRITESLGDEPEVQARLLFTLGSLFSNLAAYDKAIPPLELALAQRERMEQGDTPEMANILAALGEARRATDDLDGALAAHRRALHIRTGRGPGNLLAIAQSHSDLGMVARAAGDYEEADARLGMSISLLHQLEESPAVLEALATALNARAVLYSLTSRLVDAEVAHRSALEIKLKLYGDLHPSIATTLNNLGAVLAKQTKVQEAEIVYRRALTMREQLFKEDNPRISTTLNNLASTLLRSGKLDEAERLYRRSLEIRKTQGYPSAAVATSLNNLAGLLRAKGDADGALAAYVESLNVRRAVQGDEHPNTAITQVNLAEHLAETGHAEESCKHIADALTVLTTALKPDHWRLAMAKSVWGGCLASRGEFQDAESLMVSTLEVIRANRGDQSEYARSATQRLIDLYSKLGRANERDRYEELLQAMTLPEH